MSMWYSGMETSHPQFLGHHSLDIDHFHYLRCPHTCSTHLVQLEYEIPTQWQAQVAHASPTFLTEEHRENVYHFGPHFQKNADK